MSIPRQWLSRLQDVLIPADKRRRRHLLAKYGQSKNIAGLQAVHSEFYHYILAREGIDHDRTRTALLPLVDLYRESGQLRRAQALIEASLLRARCAADRDGHTVWKITSAAICRLVYRIALIVYDRGIKREYAHAQVLLATVQEWHSQYRSHLRTDDWYAVQMTQAAFMGESPLERGEIPTIIARRQGRQARFLINAHVLQAETHRQADNLIAARDHLEAALEMGETMERDGHVLTLTLLHVRNRRHSLYQHCLARLNRRSQAQRFRVKGSEFYSDQIQAFLEAAQSSPELGKLPVVIVALSNVRSDPPHYASGTPVSEEDTVCATISYGKSSGSPATSWRYELTAERDDDDDDDGSETMTPRLSDGSFACPAAIGVGWLPVSPRHDLVTEAGSPPLVGKSPQFDLTRHTTTVNFSHLCELSHSVRL